MDRARLFLKRGLLALGLLIIPTLLLAQGPYSAQIQQALQAFVQQAHTWTATQTFSSIIVGGCTGCGGGGNVTSTSAYASPPASPASGDLWFPTNTYYAFRSTGSAWVPWGPIWPLTDPTTPSWSWVNQGSATVATTNGAVFLNGTANASANLRIRVKNVPTAPYTVTAAFIPLLTTANFSGAGLILRNSGSGNLVLFDYLGDTNVVEASKWSSPTTAVAAYSVTSAFRFFNPVFWFRIEDNNTNRILSVSADGVNFAVIFTVSRTDYITPDQIGFFVKDQNATYAPAMTLLSWKES